MGFPSSSRFVRTSLVRPSYTIRRNIRTVSRGAVAETDNPAS